MGGSTNTILHLLAVAHEAKVDFTMKDMDELSKRVPCLCKVAPSSHYHMEDVNQAGGIFSILGELDRGGLIDKSVSRVDFPTLGEALEKYDVIRPTAIPEAVHLYKSAPGGIPTIVMGSQKRYFDELDLNRESGCIRDMDHAYYKDGGLAILFGNIATKGCVVKTAGVDASLFNFKGKAVVFESQDEAVEGILGDKVNKGDVVVIRYEGPKGGPGMQEMLYPTTYLKSKKIDKYCALITDGRFSGGSSGLSIGHMSPEAAAKGEIALIRDGDLIEIDIKNRGLNLLISDEELEKRRLEEAAQGKLAYKPKNRIRPISEALKLYSLHVTSAHMGAVRVLDEE
jgi:dihydroxy-acid dehydratase